jgi:cytidylate kinase
MRYIDTGAMYRAITLYCMRNNLIQNKKVDLGLLQNSLDKITINFEFNAVLKKSETFLNNENVEDLIRGIEVSENVSIIAQIKEVREKLILLQQEIGKSKNVVMDGRDIGTVVFPNAKLKLFVTASSEVRAKRRFDELVIKGDIVSFDEVLGNLNQRDEHDTNRKINPLIMAKDAVLINNTDLSIAEQNSKIDKLIQSKI